MLSGESLVSSSGALLMRKRFGSRVWIVACRARWRRGGRPRAVHDPGKVLLDVATAVALGGDCLADVAAVRAQPELFGPVASDPTVSRLFAALAADVDAAVRGDPRRPGPRARAGSGSRRRPLAGTPGPPRRRSGDRRHRRHAW